MELDKEFEAIKCIFQALKPLEDEARARVITYIIARLDIAINDEAEDDRSDFPKDSAAALQEEQANAPKFSSFAELVDAAQPGNNSHKALLAGYWLQVCNGQEDFDGQSANRELKHLGEVVANITVAINSLKSQKPSLVIQLRKSGKSRQARKTYKVTVAGIKAVESMIGA